MKQRKKWNLFYSFQKRESFLHFTEEQLNEILKKFPNTKTTLDIGCGEGQLLAQLENRGIQATGIDVSDIGLEEARNHFGGSLILGDFEKYIFPKDILFDLIFVKFVIAFIQYPESFFKKVHQLLSSGGALILLTPVMSKPNSLSREEEVFVDQTVLDRELPKYFSRRDETVLYADGDKRLVLYTCMKD